MTEEALQLIRWRIGTVQLPPGTRFTEPELAESLKLSRTPVREALLLLRTQGFVTVEGRAGYRVSPVTLRDVHELASVRGILEGEAAYLAAGRLMQAGEMEALTARVPSPPNLSAPNTATSWIESDHRFHVALAVAGGNRKLLDTLEPIFHSFTRLMHLMLALDHQTAELTHEHEGLLAALRARDGERARAVVAEQITGMEHSIARALMYSPTLQSTNVVVESPQNQFYLDVAPEEVAGADRADLAAQPRAKLQLNARKPQEPLGVKR